MREISVTEARRAIRGNEEFRDSKDFGEHKVPLVRSGNKVIEDFRARSVCKGWEEISGTGDTREMWGPKAR